MLNRLSLRHSIPLLLALFALLVELTLICIHLPRSTQETEQAWRQHASQLLAVMQGNLNDQLRLQRTAELDSTLSDLSSLDGVQWAAVVDRRLQPMASSRLGLDLTGYTQLGSLMSIGAPRWEALASHHYLAIYPLRADGNLDGQPGHALLVNWDFNPMIKAQQREVWVQLTEIPLLMLGLGILLSILYNRLVTHRLNAIGRITEAFASGDTSVRASTEGRDEISLLGQRVNSMIEQIDADRRALRRNELLLRSLIEAAPIGMLILDEDGRIDTANPAAGRLFACDPQRLSGQMATALLGIARLWPELLANPNVSHEIEQSLENHQLALEVSCTPFQRNGHPQFLLLMRDISDRKQAEARLHYLAHHDTLTGTANRNQLLLHLEQRLVQHEPQSMLFIDLDHFKRINDTLGHDIGDELLRAVAERLQQMIPEDQSLLARLGGDEFIILLSGDQAAIATELGEQLLTAFRDPFMVQQYELYITPSIGITHHTHGRAGSTQMLKEADLALYKAKNQGRNRIAHFDHRLAEDAVERRLLEIELRSALAGEQFELYYQPQVSLDGRLHSFEALLRWHSPTRGLVPPNHFLPALEETGLILEATQWVFRQACLQQVRWQQAGLDWRIAVNLSPLDFRQSDLAGNLCRILDDTGAAPDMLELEVTESALLDADRHVLKTLQQLRARGMSLFLDDFGTGYASLAYLRTFPFDGVKIDRQFVTGLPENRQSRALVRGILVMAEQMGMEVVAEGVEDERQAAFLRGHGCQRLQGYLFGKPQPARAAANTSLASQH